MKREKTIYLAVPMVILLLCASNGPAALVYEYDARDLSLGAATAWNDTAAAGVDTRDWTMPGGSTTVVVATSHGTLTQAVDFDGTQATNSSSTDSFGTSDAFTNGTGGRNASFEIWVNPDSVSSAQLVFETGGSVHGAALQINSGGTVTFFTRESNSNTDITSTAVLSTTDFSQIVGVVDEANNRTRLYINGAEQGTGTAGTRDWTMGGNDAGLARATENGGGSGAGDNPLAGEIALVRIYNDTLTSGDVSTIYAQTVPEPSTFALAAFGLASLGLVLWRRRRG